MVTVLSHSCYSTNMNEKPNLILCSNSFYFNHHTFTSDPNTLTVTIFTHSSKQQTAERVDQLQKTVVCKSAGVRHQRTGISVLRETNASCIVTLAY